MSGELDAIDAKIASLLVRDAKTKVSDIARRCGLSRQTVAARIRKMESSRLIKGYRAVLDYEKLGVKFFFVLFLKLGLLDEANSSAALKEFLASPNVLLDCSVTGEWDVLQILGFRSTQEYDEFIHRLRTVYGSLFRDTKSHAVLKFFKSFEQYDPLA